MPRISVIMSVFFERVDWIRKSIDSILMQSFSDFEFIIVNDNPERIENAQLLAEYSRLDSRVKVITNNGNIGLTKSLNKAIILAEGEYIARMDADDIAIKERLKIQLEFMKAHPEFIACGGNAYAINENDEIIGHINMPSEKNMMSCYSLFASPLVHPASFFRNGFIRYDESYRYAQDYALWVSLIGKGYKITNIRTKVLKYRYSDSQIFRKHKQEQTKCAERILKHAFDNLKICSTDEIIKNWNLINNEIPISIDKHRELQTFVIKFLNFNMLKLSKKEYNYIANKLLLNLLLKCNNGRINTIGKYLTMRNQVKCNFDTKVFLILCLN